VTGILLAIEQVSTQSRPSGKTTCFLSLGGTAHEVMVTAFGHLTKRRRRGWWGWSVFPVSPIGQRIAFMNREEWDNMPLVNIVVALIVVGVALYLINRFIPMASSIKTILNAVVVVVVVVWVLQVFGLWSGIRSFRVGG